MTRKLDNTVSPTNISYRREKRRKMDLKKLFKNYIKNKIPELKNVFSQ